MENKRERAEKAKKHLKALSEWVTQEVNDLSNPPGFFYLHMKLQEAINDNLRIISSCKPCLKPGTEDLSLPSGRYQNAQISRVDILFDQDISLLPQDVVKVQLPK